MDPLTDLTARMLPFAKLLGMTFTAAEPDRVTAEMLVRDDLCTRPAGKDPRVAGQRGLPDGGAAGGPRPPHRQATTSSMAPVTARNGP